MSNEELLIKVSDAIVSGDVDGALAAGQAALDAGMPAEDILQKGGTRGLDIVGEMFENLEIFMPELLVCSEAMKSLLAQMKPHLKAGEGSVADVKVVIGTCYGDMHDMGKNITALEMSLHGYDVIDLGANVSNKEFYRAAEEHQARIIAMSALMTTSAFYQKDMVEYLVEQGKRDQYYVILGGGVVTERWTAECGADGYGRMATDGVIVSDMLIKSGAAPGTSTINVFQGSTTKADKGQTLL
jgi:trimethylamine corrinoid protein